MRIIFSIYLHDFFGAEIQKKTGRSLLKPWAGEQNLILLSLIKHNNIYLDTLGLSEIIERKDFRIC